MIRLPSELRLQHGRLSAPTRRARSLGLAVLKFSSLFMAAVVPVACGIAIPIPVPGSDKDVRQSASAAALSYDRVFRPCLVAAVNLEEVLDHLAGKTIRSPKHPNARCTLEYGLALRLRTKCAEQVLTLCRQTLMKRAGARNIDNERALAQEAIVRATAVWEQESEALRTWHEGFSSCQSPTLSSEGWGFWTR